MHPEKGADYRFATQSGFCNAPGRVLREKTRSGNPLRASSMLDFLAQSSLAPTPPKYIRKNPSVDAEISNEGYASPGLIIAGFPTRCFIVSCLRDT